jgi:hypothetical protein
MFAIPVFLAAQAAQRSPSPGCDAALDMARKSVYSPARRDSGPL